MRLSPVLRNFLLVLCAFAPAAVYAQPAAPVSKEYMLSNPSFEDRPQAGDPPRGWYDCGFSSESPVDVHPAHLIMDTTFFGVDMDAFDGNTYLGMVVRENETYESVSQRLVDGPLEAGKCYTFSIYLAREAHYISATSTDNNEVKNYNTPAKLRIYGGFSYCNRGEIIAESAPVKNTEWLQYNFRFEPKKTHNFIVLEAYYKTPMLFPYNGNLLLDAAGKIVAVPCDNSAPVVEEPAEEPVVAEADPKPEVRQPVVSPPVAEQPTRSSTPTPTPRTTKLQGYSRADLRTGSIIKVEKLYFRPDSTDVKPESLPTLNEISEFLTVNADVVIEVGGHTSNQPPHEYCDWLSGERAKSVVEYLKQQGIAESRLFSKGYGKRNPVATNKTAVGRQRNRRVEIKILAIAEQRRGGQG